MAVIAIRHCPYCGSDINSTGSAPSLPEEIQDLPVPQETDCDPLLRRHQLAHRNAGTSVKRSEVKFSENDELYFWLIAPGVPAFVTTGYYVTSLVEPYWLGIMAASGYLLLIQAVAGLCLRRVTGLGSFILHWSAWAWFYYWTILEQLLAPAFAGVLLFLLTAGRMMMWMHMSRERRGHT